VIAPGPAARSVDDLMAVVQGAVRRYPLQALGIGLLAGFVIGGGERSLAGRRLIGFAVPMALRQAVIATLAEVLGDHERHC
jgi:hypothetical protein